MDELNRLTKRAILQAKLLQAEVSFLPPEEGIKPTSQHVIASVLVRKTEPYIEKIVDQINGCYEHGLYDGCAVMIRRLLETLIIETFEEHRIDSKIKNSDGDFFMLKKLIDLTLAESAWNLSRNVKRALPDLKDIGDLSAHSRRFNAYRHDIDDLKRQLRIVVQEFVVLAGLKRV